MARTARTANTLIKTPAAIATPAVSHLDRDRRGNGLCPIERGLGNEVRRGAQVPGQIDRDRNVPQRQDDDQRSNKPGHGADDRQREILHQHLLADMPPGPSDGLKDRHFAAPLRRRRGRAPHESRRKNADDRRDDQSHALREKEHAGQRLPHRQFARDDAFLAEQAVILFTTASNCSRSASTNTRLVSAGPNG